MQVARPAPAFRKLAHHLHPHELLAGLGALHLIMDRAYEDNKTRQLPLDFGFVLKRQLKA